MNLKKGLLSLALAASLVATPFIVFGETDKAFVGYKAVEGQEVNSDLSVLRVCDPGLVGWEAVEDQEVNAKFCATGELNDSNLNLSVHEVSKDLNSTWTELYNDGNWFDAIATIQNLSSNPGSIDVRVDVLDKAGMSLTLCSKNGVPTGCAWTTCAISGSSYKSYTVYVRASSGSGNYTLKYWDDPA